MFARILVPVDDGRSARRAAKFALELAARYDAAVDVLHVIEEEDAEHGAADREEAGREILRAATDFEVSQRTSVETHLLRGGLTDALTRHIEDHEVDLIVAGRSGRSGVGERLLGNVAERILRTAGVPVLTVTDGDVTSETGQTFDSILLPTDGSDTAAQAAPVAADLARRLEATLHILSVIHVEAEAGAFDAGGVPEDFVERLREERRDALDDLLVRIDATDIETRTEFREGEPHSEIDAYVEDVGIDLTVMASSGMTSLVGQQVRSTARRVLETIDGPVLVVPVTE